MARVELNIQAPDFTLNDFSGKSVSLSYYKNKIIHGGFQQRILLTILPRAHGAVAPRLSKICKAGYGNHRCRAGKKPKLSKITGQKKICRLWFARSRTQGFEIVRSGSQDIQIGKNAAQMLIDKSGKVRFGSLRPFNV